jgi:glucokinase
MNSAVIVSGIPGSGKTTLGRRLAAALDWPLIDKDHILERLFASEGVGDSAWRRLSRESDAILQREAEALDRVVLVSFWHVPGMTNDSGTPIDWLRTQSRVIVNVHCACPPQVAAGRFARRTRHVGHGDGTIPPEDLIADFQRLAELGCLRFAHRLDIDTSREVDVEALISAVRSLIPHSRSSVL